MVNKTETNSELQQQVVNLALSDLLVDKIAQAGGLESGKPPSVYCTFKTVEGGINETALVNAEKAILGQFEKRHWELESNNYAGEYMVSAYPGGIPKWVDLQKIAESLQAAASETIKKVYEALYSLSDYRNRTNNLFVTVSSVHGRAGSLRVKLHLLPYGYLPKIDPDCSVYKAITQELTNQGEDTGHREVYVNWLKGCLNYALAEMGILAHTESDTDFDGGLLDYGRMLVTLFIKSDTGDAVGDVSHCLSKNQYNELGAFVEHYLPDAEAFLAGSQCGNAGKYALLHYSVERTPDTGFCGLRAEAKQVKRALDSICNSASDITRGGVHVRWHHRRDFDDGVLKIVISGGGFDSASVASVFTLVAQSVGSAFPRCTVAHDTSSSKGSYGGTVTRFSLRFSVDFRNPI